MDATNKVRPRKAKLTLRLKRYLLSALGALYRPLRYKTCYFFDTNFFVLPKERLPRWIPSLNRNYKLTETVAGEIKGKLGEARFKERTASRYSIIGFHDLYRISPTACPVYYFYLSAMYNPANIGSEDFYQEWYNSQILKGRNISDASRAAYEKIRRASSSGSQLDPIGQPKSARLKLLEKFHTQTLKKEKESLKDKHPALMNDIRSLSLALLYALMTRQNVVYYTADGDAVTHFIKWMDSISTQAALRHLIFIRLTRKKKRDLLRGQRLRFFLDYKTFLERREGIYRDLVSDFWKENGFRFTICYWDRAEKKLLSPVYATFNKVTTSVLLSLSCGLTCPFAKNDTLGGWLSWRYWPPRKLNDSRIKVYAQKTSIINRKSTIVTPEFHDSACRYRQEDKSGAIQQWSSFK